MTCKRSRSRCGEVAFWRLGVVELDALLCYFDVAFGEEDLEWSGGCFKVVVEGSAVLKVVDGFKVGWWKKGLPLKSSIAIHVEFICPWPSDH